MRPRQSNSKKAMFEPPFRGLWIAALLYFCISCVLSPGSPIWTGELSDPDDYIYLDQVIDWIQGQGWFDNYQHHLNPPDGVPMHFSRLTQLPMAALILFFKLFGMTTKSAALAMALILPVFLLVGLFLAVRWIADSYMPKQWSGVTAYVLLFSMSLLTYFLPGHIDHHGLDVLLTAIATGHAARMIKSPESMRWPIGAGITLALAMTVALEMLPWLVCISAWLCIWAISVSKKAASCGLIFGLSLFASSVVFLLLTQSPGNIFDANIVSYSIVYVEFTAAIFTVFFTAFLGARFNDAVRWILGTSTGIIAALIYFITYPALLTSPFGAVDPALSALLLDNLMESQSLIQLKHSVLMAIICVIAPLIALTTATHQILNAKPADRWAWGLMLVLLTGSLMLTCLYGYRYAGALGLFTVVPLAVLLQQGWKYAAKEWRGWHKIIAQISLLLLVGPLPVIIPATLDHHTIMENEAIACHLNNMGSIFDTGHGKPKIVMNTTDIGPEMIFSTKALPIAASFHENIGGNLDAMKFFSAVNSSEAEDIARRRNIDIVFICNSNEDLYSNTPAIQRQILKNKSEQTNLRKTFIHDLISGENIPEWLHPVPLEAKTGYKIYEVVRSSDNQSDAF